MSYAVVYSSRTGNTALLAKTIQEMLPSKDCIYFGEPDSCALAAEEIYVGFWTDKGTCDTLIAQFLQGLTDQKVFLFGTAGFGGDAAYFDQILLRVRENLGENVKLCGTYMCQGKMPQSVRERYEEMEDSPRRTAMLKNFDLAVTHPDEKDLNQFKQAIKQFSHSAF